MPCETLASLYLSKGCFHGQLGRVSGIHSRAEGLDQAFKSLLPEIAPHKLLYTLLVPCIMSLSDRTASPPPGRQSKKLAKTSKHATLSSLPTAWESEALRSTCCCMRQRYLLFRCTVNIMVAERGPATGRTNYKLPHSRASLSFFPFVSNCLEVVARLALLA